MGNLVFQATLGGQVNLVGPNTASTFNLNVPAVSSTIASLAAQTFAGTQTFTLDAVVNGLTVGKGGGSGSTNTVVGNGALAASASNQYMTAIGNVALAANTTGFYATAVGAYALNANTTGTDNTAVGTQALDTNTTGSFNTGLGRFALHSNTTASYNTAVGYQAQYTNTTGTGTAFGAFALKSNTTGTNNTALGGYDNSSGVYGALQTNTTGSYNIAVGTGALQANTTASNNTAVGYQAGYSQTTSPDNVFMGNKAGYSTSTGGGSNTFIGQQAGYSHTTGQNNQFFGGGAGYYISTGSKNTVIGAYTGNQGGLDIRTSSNYVVLSDGDGNVAFYGTPNNGTSFLNCPATRFTQLGFANNAVQKAAIWWDNTNLTLQTYTNTNGPYLSNGGTSWTNSSDERLKNITGEIQNGLAKVCTLRAAEYTWKADAEAKPQVGLIAQDVLAVLPEAVQIPVEGATEKDGSPTMMGVQYTDVIPLLVAAIKELKAEFDAYKATHP